jgi:hypothetical protein
VTLTDDQGPVGEPPDEEPDEPLEVDPDEPAVTNTDTTEHDDWARELAQARRDMRDVKPPPTIRLAFEGNGQATGPHITGPLYDRLTTNTGWIDLAPIIRGDQPPATPTITQRTDGQGLFYPAALHDLHGEPGHGKSWLTLHAGAETLTNGGAFALLDYEGSAHTFIERMRALGTPDDTLADPDRVSYHNLIGKTTPAQIDALVRAFTDMGVTLVAIDSMLPALIRNGYDDNSNRDQADFYDTLTRPLTASGAAICCVDHMTKDPTTRNRGARGGGAKLQLVDVSYSVRLGKSFSRDRPGNFKIVCDKDRFGTYSIGETVADIHLEPAAGGTVVNVTVRTPEAHGDEPFRPTYLMERVSQALEAHGELSLNGIKAAVKGDDKAKALATEILVNEGFVTRERHGQTLAHTSVRPFPPPDQGAEVDQGEPR